MADAGKIGVLPPADEIRDIDLSVIEQNCKETGRQHPVFKIFCGR